MTMPERADDCPPALSIVSGNPTASEIAAVTAVIVSLLEEIEDEAQLDAARRMSPWQRSQRAVRAPLTPGYGAWRNFTG